MGNGTTALKATDLEEMKEKEIEMMLGNRGIFSEEEVAPLIKQMISQQEGGVEGELDSSGYGNIFLTPTHVVVVFWHEEFRMWFTGICPRAEGSIWTGVRVFSPA